VTKSKSLKKLDRRIRNYNRTHFKSEPIEQPPWGIDQQRLKRYAERVIEMAARSPEHLASPYRTINPEYFAGKTNRKDGQRIKRKSKSKGKKENYD
jgi:hypothetical protein